MKYIKTFKQLNKKSVGEAGGKGASLGEMTNAKIPVPPGFVILASAFDRFLDETDLGTDIDVQLKKVIYKDINSVDRYSNVIRDLIADVKFPTDLGEEIIKSYNQLFSSTTSPRSAVHSSSARRGGFVAVRSSATAEDSSIASWAGELETYLNITEKDLLKKVKLCWSSLFTPRAIFYRREKKLHNTHVSVAVVVQAMIQSEISGIAFTVHPVTEDRNQMVIEAGYGLGETIVSGQVTPDSYIISKKDMVLIDINVSDQEKMLVKKGNGNKMVAVKKADIGKQKLTGRQILELAKICAGIEKHYRLPCDIEWAYAKGKFYIVQSRPITTLKK
ncbi:MAG: hypothetical protein COT91_01580 [Candidatus Doudnabacteria bacterium CG10_big_fil_rev_8_21_14_0_10_41_10]|uniref:Phosphoenolpyruvate synthase n=1 Tax=Candidatus Doudnabacteria bacterium CG10_big_fil_rev_8_21_14_0_10_41_10 TaxID=1974551 RepID=A0A2H0VEA0_9BACT|nr:MAG: hypothetical protein COT91_01580 [Candidatus Doudnabacteria bacterium CG10_big_fil_rev_8_21_14_0_10_41_10]